VGQRSRPDSRMRLTPIACLDRRSGIQQNITLGRFGAAPRAPRVLHPLGGRGGPPAGRGSHWPDRVKASARLLGATRVRLVRWRSAKARHPAGGRVRRTFTSWPWRDGRSPWLPAATHHRALPPVARPAGRRHRAAGPMAGGCDHRRGPGTHARLGAPHSRDPPEGATRACVIPRVPQESWDVRYPSPQHVPVRRRTGAPSARAPASRRDPGTVAVPVAGSATSLRRPRGCDAFRPGHC